MKTLPYESKLKGLGSTIYLQPLVFEFMILTIYCKSWLFQALISHGRWCNTEEKEQLRDESRDQNHILCCCGFPSKPRRCLCHHYRAIVGHVPRLQGMWKMCGGLGQGVRTLQRCCGSVTKITFSHLVHTFNLMSHLSPSIIRIK